MYHKIALLRHWEKCNNSGCIPPYETLFISEDASVTGAQGYVYWRPGDPIYEDRDMILLEDNLAQDETCARLVHTSVCVLLLLLSSSLIPLDFQNMVICC